MNIGNFISYYCNSIQSCLQGLYNLGVALAVVLAFFMFFFGAFKNLLSVVPDVKTEGKTMMRNSIIGLVVIFLSGAVLYWINPFIFDPRITIYRVVIKIVPNVISTTTSINIGGRNFNIPTLDFDLNIDPNNARCISEEITIRTTAYYIPLYNEEPNKHKFLSNVTLQGKGIIEDGNQLKSLNYISAKIILATSALSDRKLDRCRNDWHWSWVGVTGSPSRRCYAAKTNQRESTNYYYGVLNPNQVEILSLAMSVPINGPLRGAYGPLSAGKTAARDRNSKNFQEFDVVKILNCLDNNNEPVDCGIKNNLFVITDTGGGGDNWLDLFAGIGEEEKNNFVNKKTDWAKVCVVGKATEF